MEAIERNSDGFVVSDLYVLVYAERRMERIRRYEVSLHKKRSLSYER